MRTTNNSMVSLNLMAPFLIIKPLKFLSKFIGRISLHCPLNGLRSSPWICWLASTITSITASAISTTCRCASPGIHPSISSNIGSNLGQSRERTSEAKDSITTSLNLLLSTSHPTLSIAHFQIQPDLDLRVTSFICCSRYHMLHSN